MHKILIVGGGAIGGTMAVILKNKGYPVHLLLKNPETVEIALHSGFRITGFKGDLSEKIPAWLPSDLLREKYDFVLLAVKAYDMEVAAQQILPFLKDDSLVVSLQNGLCEDDLAAITGRERTVGCVVGYGATLVERGFFDMTSGGELILGTLDGRKDTRIEEMARMFSHIVPTYITENIYGALYSKLIINSCITTLGVISGQRLGKMLMKNRIRKIFIAIIREAMEVAGLMDIKVEPYAGKVNYYRFTGSLSWFDLLRIHTLILVIGIKYRRLKSSSLQSVERGKPTEIDWFNGYIVRNAERLGLDARVNKELVQLVKDIEKGKIKPEMDNFRGSLAQKINTKLSLT
jgi:2-dehydropantoate 2-reductase